MERIGVRRAMDGNGLDAELAACMDDSKGYFSPIGDKDLLEHGELAASGRPDQEQRLSELDRLCILGVDLLDDSRLVGLDLVHQLHRFDDAQDLTHFDLVAFLYIGVGIGVRRPVEGADDGRLEDVPVDGCLRTALGASGPGVTDGDWVSVACGSLAITWAGVSTLPSIRIRKPCRSISSPVSPRSQTRSINSFI
jgi:hypothetical protein